MYRCKNDEELIASVKKMPQTDNKITLDECIQIYVNKMWELMSQPRGVATNFFNTTEPIDYAVKLGLCIEITKQDFMFDAKEFN